MQVKSKQNEDIGIDGTELTLFDEIKSSLIEAIAIEESKNKKRSFDSSIEHHSASFDFLKKSKRED